jgi:hypothetical protein
MDHHSRGGRPPPYAVPTPPQREAHWQSEARGEKIRERDREMRGDSRGVGSDVHQSSSSPRSTATDIARSIGLAVHTRSPGQRGQTAADAPSSPPSHSSNAFQMLGAPMQPIPHSGPLSSSSIPLPMTKEYTSGPRYQRLTTETISALVEGPDGHSSRSGPASMGSQRSVRSMASFDPSTVSGERSYDSYASWNSARQIDGRLAPQSSVDLAAAQRHDADDREDLERLRDSLPPELRTYGAPVEYIAVPPSPKQSQPGSASSSSSRLNSDLRRSTSGMDNHNNSRGTLDSLGPPVDLWGSAPARSSRIHHSSAPMADSPRSRGSNMSLVANQEHEAGANDDSESQRRSMLSDAMIRKLKQKNSQLDEEVRAKKKQIEELVRNVTSWKKSIKDRNSTKLEQLEQALKSKVYQERERGRMLKIKLISSVVRRYKVLTKMACLHHWHHRVQYAKARAKLVEADGRWSSSEKMVLFLKEQLSATGQVRVWFYLSHAR